MNEKHKTWLIIGGILVIVGLLSEVLIAIGVIILVVVLVLHLKEGKAKGREEKGIGKRRSQRKR